MDKQINYTLLNLKMCAGKDTIKKVKIKPL